MIIPRNDFNRKGSRLDEKSSCEVIHVWDKLLTVLLISCSLEIRGPLAQATARTAWKVAPPFIKILDISLKNIVETPPGVHPAVSLKTK